MLTPVGSKGIIPSLGGIFACGNGSYKFNRDHRSALFLRLRVLEKVRGSTYYE